MKALFLTCLLAFSGGTIAETLAARPVALAMPAATHSYKTPDKGLFGIFKPKKHKKHRAAYLRAR
jgi:hypothetical protein